MELINQLSWCAYFEQRGNQQRKSLGKSLLEEGVQGSVWAREQRREVHLYWGTGGEGRNVWWKIIHLACIAAGSRLSLALLHTGSILQRQAMGRESSRLPALFQKEQCGGWKGSYGKPFPLCCSCYLVGLHSVKKTPNHLQLYPVRHISSVVCI